jgi:hypothetical protein
MTAAEYSGSNTFRLPRTTDFLVHATGVQTIIVLGIDVSPRPRRKAVTCGISGCRQGLRTGHIPASHAGYLGIGDDDEFTTQDRAWRLCDDRARSRACSAVCPSRNLPPRLPSAGGDSRRTRSFDPSPASRRSQAAMSSERALARIFDVPAICWSRAVLLPTARSDEPIS